MSAYTQARSAAVMQELQRHFGRQFRTVYEPVAQGELPDRFRELLTLAEQRQRFPQSLSDCDEPGQGMQHRGAAHG